MDKRSGSSGMIIAFAVMFYIIAVFIVLHCVHVKYSGPYGTTKSISESITEGVDEALSEPFNLKGLGKHKDEAVKVVFVMTLLVGIFGAYEWSMSQSKAHESEKTAKGSSDFATNYRLFYKKFTNFNPVIDKKENPVVAFFLDTFSKNTWY